MERKLSDSVIIDTIKNIRYELKKVNRRDLRFKAIQLQADPKLREALERASTETIVEKRKMARDEKLLEGLAE